MRWSPRAGPNLNKMESFAAARTEEWATADKSQHVVLRLDSNRQATQIKMQKREAMGCTVEFCGSHVVNCCRDMFSFRKKESETTIL